MAHEIIALQRRFRSRSRHDRKRLQALRTFTAGDACYNDGANPLSFRIGDTFTFLSRRDELWLNVERNLWVNNGLLKQRDIYPATERGIVPEDYVIDMSVNGTVVSDSTAESATTDTNEAATSTEMIQQAGKKQVDELAKELDQVKKRLDETSKENLAWTARSRKEYSHNVQLLHQLLQQYYAVSEMLVATKEQLEIAHHSLIEEQEKCQKFEEKIEDFRQQITKSGNKSTIKLLEKNFPKDSKKQSNGYLPQGKDTTKPGTASEDELKLSCTLCSEKIRVSELSRHSKVCSASQEKAKQPKTPTTLGTTADMLRVSVTCSETDYKTDTTFKVVTKTTVPDYEFPLYEVHRREVDFVWLQAALQESCPQRIVPPQVSSTSLNGTTRELQRFLSRICDHKVFRKHDLLQLFLTGQNQDIERARVNFNKKKKRLGSKSVDDIKHKREPSDQNAPLLKCKRYLEQLSASLQGLVSHLQDNLRKDSTEGSGFWFKKIADGEPGDTYLKVATSGLSKICNELEHNREIADETLIVSDLFSVLEYVKSAQALLERVDSAADEFLYWDDETRTYEEEKKPGTDNEDGKGDLDQHTLTQRWAEANSHCAEAKSWLETVCQPLSAELEHFDLRKEKELREILIEYCTTKSEHYEKVQSKWFGVKFMVELPVAAEVRAIKCIEDF